MLKTILLGALLASSSTFAKQAKLNIKGDNIISQVKKLKNNGMDEFSKLQSVQTMINLQIKFKDDVGDYWQSPEESLIRRTGDCEDYAFLKYFMLRQLGFSEENLRVAYVYYKETFSGNNLAHMVLVVKLNDTNYLMDNMRANVVELSNVKDLTFKYSMNQIGEYKELSMEPSYVNLYLKFQNLVGDIHYSIFEEKVENFINN